jgi:murein DD-endopeptidase MepM/ murein hydrolase activator NlpD
MGTTGTSTGKHLHWELRAGKKHTWSETGKSYIEPVAFFDALIKWEASIATAPIEAKETDPVLPVPAHSVPVEESVAPAEPSVALPTPVVTPTPAPAPAKATLKVGSKGSLVKVLQKKLGVTADGDFGPNTKNAVMAFQSKHGLVADGIVGAKTWAALG